ncbi:TPA: hypothetical protein DDW35_12140 [Candidatus Sumerlaeota bacterium]|nr:hypothetical protein [Candidatus Sumerlaeota bacterium]
MRMRVGRGPLAAALFYCVALFPILGFVPWSLMNMTPVQDHYQYVACMGPFLIFVAAFEKYVPRLFSRRIISYGAFALLILLPSAIFAQQHARLYQDRETLFHENYLRYPQANMVANHYALGLMNKQQYPQAYLLMERVTQQQPLDAKNWRFKAQLLWRLNRLQEACDAYEKTITLTKAYEPVSAERDAETLYQYGSLLLQMNCPDKALDVLRQANDLTNGKIPEIQKALEQAQAHTGKEARP